MSNAAAPRTTVSARYVPPTLSGLSPSIRRMSASRAAAFSRNGWLMHSSTRKIFVHVGVVRKGALVGFAFARILRGEFGREQATATLDAVGVEHDSREHGVGHALMDGLTKVMRQKGVQSLQSQADWTNHGLLRFFDSSGFRLAPRLVLERSVLTPLAESPDDE